MGLIEPYFGDTEELSQIHDLRARAAELPSEGLVAGAVQVPPDGQPVVLLADHPVTGGYPVVAVVESGDLWRCAQLRPGDRVEFTPAPSATG